MDKLHTFIHSYFIPWVTTRPPETWFALGVFVFLVLSVTGITAWKRWRYLQQHGEELGTKVTLISVQVWSMVLVGSTQVLDAITNGSQMFGSFIPSEYIGMATKVSVAAVSFHMFAVKALDVSKKVHKWFVDRKAAKAQKALTGSQIPAAIQNAADQLPANPAPVTTNLWQDVQK